MNEPALISDPNTVTSEWLTGILAFNGIEGTVKQFTATSIGTGQIGENVRFTLKGEGDIPHTIVGKFTSPDPLSRQTGIQLQNYKREVHFYRNINDRVAIQTPRILYAGIDDATHDFAIIMEDLAPGRQGDQIAGCGESEAQIAMTQLAHLHGPAWNRTELIDGEIVVDRNADNGDATKQLYDSLAPGFLERYGNRLTEEEQQMVTLVGEQMEAYANNYQGESTLIHIDYRLDNMMFGGPYPLAVVDWQSVAFACALNDAAYFVGTSVRQEERRQLDEPLLRSYYDTLSTYNTNLTWDDCWKYYRQHAPAGLIMAVIASMIVGETERGNEMFMAMARRSAAMSRELDSIEALREN